MHVVNEQSADRYRHVVPGSAAAVSFGSREISVSNLIALPGAAAEGRRNEQIERAGAIRPVRNAVEQVIGAENPVAMSAGMTCTIVGTDTGARWLHTPKFGPHHHFQRWRSAT